MVHMIVKAGGRGHRIVFSSLTHCEQPQAVQGRRPRRWSRKAVHEAEGRMVHMIVLPSRPKAGGR